MAQSELICLSRQELIVWHDLNTSLLDIIGKIKKPAAGADFSEIFLYPEIEKLKVEKKTLVPHNYYMIYSMCSIKPNVF